MANHFYYHIDLKGERLSTLGPITDPEVLKLYRIANAKTPQDAIAQFNDDKEVFESQALQLDYQYSRFNY